MDTLKEAQDIWAESLLSDNEFCDAVAVLREGHRVPFLRPLLANLSLPLRKALWSGLMETWFWDVWS